MSDRLPRLVLFPGLGADGRLYAPQRAALPHLEVPDWLEPTRDEPLSAYAARMARVIDPAPPLYVGGISYGAMVALEVARYVPVSGVFHIGGCRSSADIGLPFSVVADTARWVPPFLLPAAIRLFPLVLDVLEKLDDAQKALYVEMVNATPPHRLRFGAAQMMGWRFEGPDPAPVFSIHGRLDRVIPISRLDRTPDAIVPGGRHLISLTHSEAVNRFLLERLR